MSDTRSPIDPALLRPVLEPTLGASRTLPALAYLSDDVLGWESRALLPGRLGMRGPGRRFEERRRPACGPGRGGGRAHGPRRARPVERVLQHLSAPRTRATGARCGHQPPRDQVPVPRVGLRPGRLVERRAAVRRRARLRQERLPVGRRARRRVARLGVRERVRGRSRRSMRTSATSTSWSLRGRSIGCSSRRRTTT